MNYIFTRSDCLNNGILIMSIMLRGNEFDSLMVVVLNFVL